MNRAAFAVLTVSLVCFGATASSSALPLEGKQRAPGPILKWSVPSRYELSDDAWRTQTATYDRDYARPDGWSATFDLCDSTSRGINEPIVRYYLQLVGVGFPYKLRSDNRECLKRVNNLPRLASYDVYIAVGTSTTPLGPLVKQRIEPRDYLIVSLGDSFASGEGSPDGAGSFRLKNPSAALETLLSGSADVFTGTPVVWQDRRCHRSGRAGHALLAQQIEKQSEHSSVTFISFACSGAEVYDGLLDSYNGQEPRGAATPLPSQIGALRRLLGSGPRPRIDALLLQIGLNDLEFADIIVDCALNASAGHILDNSDCVYDHVGDKLQFESPPSGQAAEDNNLPTKYRAIAGLLRHFRTEVYVSDYPANVFHDGGCDLLKGIGDIEADTLESVGGSLRGVLLQASVEHGWNYIGGVTEAFKGHSYCAEEDSWFNGLLHSYEIQGNKEGTAHPTPAGHRAFKDVLARGVVVARTHSPLYHVSLVINRVRLGAVQRNEEVAFNLTVPIRGDMALSPIHLVRLPSRGELRVPIGGPLRFDFDVYRAPQPGRYRTTVSFNVTGIGCCGTLGAYHGLGDRFGAGGHRIKNPPGSLQIEYVVKLRAP